MTLDSYRAEHNLKLETTLPLFIDHIVYSEGFSAIRRATIVQALRYRLSFAKSYSHTIWSACRQDINRHYHSKSPFDQADFNRGCYISIFHALTLWIAERLESLLHF